MMNVSGKALLKAWRYFTSVNGSSPTGLVVVHDELELPQGRIRFKRGLFSARGHNGLKSVQSSLQSAGVLPELGGDFMAIGIGIGRPESRSSGDVSTFVLEQLSAGEKEQIAGLAEQIDAILVREAERLATGQGCGRESQSRI